MSLYNSIQGNIGLGKAIEYFTSHAIPVALPLNDTQPYDLIADINGVLSKISVKTSRYNPDGTGYCVLLKNSGGSSGVSKTRPFDNTSCDYVFIYTADNTTYLIPSNLITVTTMMTLTKKFDNFIVKAKTLQEYDEEVRHIAV